MDTDQLISKIERLRAAVGAARDTALTEIRAEVIATPAGVTVRHDFRGGLSRAAIDNLAWAVIRSISDLYDHLRKWASAHARPKDDIDSAVRASRELAIVMDLASFDKHGGHDRDQGKWSGMRPELKNLRRGLRITTAATPGAVAGMQLLPNGRIKAFGDAAVTVLGEVELLDGSTLEMGYVQQRAIEAWERLFRQFGITA